MKIKVYHENGKVKVTRVIQHGVEKVFCNDLKDGDVFEIIVDSYEIKTQTKNENGIIYV